MGKNEVFLSKNQNSNLLGEGKKKAKISLKIPKKGIWIRLCGLGREPLEGSL